MHLFCRRFEPPYLCDLLKFLLATTMSQVKKTLGNRESRWNGIVPLSNMKKAP
jgi:hypothetical protein